MVNTSKTKTKNRFKKKPTDTRGLNRKVKHLNKRQLKSNTKFKNTLMRKKTGEVILYYSIYRGWATPYSAFFINPFHALCWMHWMLMKDLILHLWHDTTERPLWHTCVGVVCVKENLVTKIQKVIPLWGEKSRHFFDSVDVFEYIGDEKLETTLIRANDDLLGKKNGLFKYHACYMQSAGSIFENNTKIIDVMPNDNINFDDWIITPYNTVGISGKYKDSKIIDVGMKVRNKLKNSKDDIDGGK